MQCLVWLMLKQVFLKLTCIWSMCTWNRDVAFTYAIYVFNTLFWSPFLLSLCNKDKQTCARKMSRISETTLCSCSWEKSSHVSWKTWINLDCFQSVMENKGHPWKIKSEVKCPRICFSSLKLFGKLSPSPFFLKIRLSEQLQLVD